MAFYLFRPPTSNWAPWQSATDSNSPLDAGTTPPPPSIPDRAKGALRAAVVAYAALVSPTPPDSGTAPIPPSVQDRAPRAQYRLANYASITPSPVDAGLPSIAPEYPDLARGPTRSQYAISVSAPLDIVVVQAPALAVMPDRALAARRALWQPPPTRSPVDIGASPTATAAFVWRDTTTQGSELGVYGFNGYILCGPDGTSSLPGYATITPAGKSDNVWSSSTSDPRALQYVPGPGRLAECWYSNGTFTVSVNLTDGLIHDIEFYCVDFDSIVRAQSVTVSDVATGTVLDIQNLVSFDQGVWLNWAIKGNLLFTFTNMGPSNAVLSGILLDPQLPAFGPQVPDRAASARRSQYTITASAPLDVVVAQPFIAAQFPDSARLPAPRRANYAQVTPTPVDAGLPGIAPEYPDRTWGTPRLANYAQFTPSPVDAGLQPIGPEYPDLASGARRSQYAICVGVPLDIVQPFIASTLPDVRGPRRAAQSAYQFTQGQLDPVDMLPDQIIPDRAPGWLRAAHTAYAGLLATTPRDSGIAPVQPIVVPAYSDRAPRSLLGAQTSYIVLVSASPRDAGTQPVFPIWPDRASAARRAALVPGSTPAPLDAGLPSIAPEYPDIAAGPRRSQYGILVQAPLDIQPIILPVTPDRAPRALRGQYQITVSAPQDQVPPSVVVVAPDRARGPRRAASYQTGTQVPLDQPVLTPFLPGHELPSSARGALRAAVSNYVVLVSVTPGDQGVITVFQPFEQAVLSKLQSIFS